MGKIVTLLKTSLFVSLIGGFVVIQYCWITTIQKDKFDKLKTRVAYSIHNAAVNIPPDSLNNTAIANALHRSFTATGLYPMPFEYKLGLGNAQVKSPGFTHNQHGLMLTYVFTQQSPNNLLTVTIPFADAMIWKDMTGTIILSALLTLMLITVFYYAAIWTKPTPFYRQRDMAIKNMMQQFESPLSTVSVAAEALRNAQVMKDLKKIKFYQRMINEENMKMNSAMKQWLKELE